MCIGSLIGGGPSKPAPIPALPAPVKETAANYDASKAAQEERRRLAAMGGQNSTFLTGGSGLKTQAPTAKKQLLGQ